MLSMKRLPLKITTVLMYSISRYLDLKSPTVSNVVGPEYANIRDAITSMENAAHKTLSLPLRPKHAMTGKKNDHGSLPGFFSTPTAYINKINNKTIKDRKKKCLD